MAIFKKNSEEKTKKSSTSSKKTSAKKTGAGAAKKARGRKKKKEESSLLWSFLMGVSVTILLFVLVLLFWQPDIFFTHKGLDKTSSKPISSERIEKQKTRMAPTRSELTKTAKKSGQDAKKTLSKNKKGVADTASSTDKNSREYLEKKKKATEEVQDILTQHERSSSGILPKLNGGAVRKLEQEKSIEQIEKKLEKNKAVDAVLRELEAFVFEEELSEDLNLLARKKFDKQTARRGNKKSPVLVLVMDDMGMSYEQIQTLLQLNIPITFAFWPHAPATDRGARAVHSKGHEIIVHLPMEPIAYPKVEPGPNTLFHNMDTVLIKRLTRLGIEKVPYAVGLNNHMGSRFTQYRTKVAAVLDVLKEYDFFALDSVTHSKSLFFDEAERQGVQAYQRSIFLDVSRKEQDIIKQLLKAEELARQKGYAIAIGHPLNETLSALKKWSRSRDKKIRLVRLQDL